MTSAVVLAVNASPPSPAPASTTSTSSGSSSSNSDFTRPLLEARQQQAKQSSSGRPSSPAASTSPPAKGKTAWSPNASQGQDKDDSKSTKDDPSDATTAMLALLGQSVPAMTPSVPVAATTGAVVDTKAAGTSDPVAAMPGLVPGMMPTGTAMASAPTAAADDADDDISALGGLKANALAGATDDTDDDIVTALATAVSTSAKADPTGQAATGSSTQNNHDDPLDALRAMTATPNMQAPVTAQATAPAHALTMNAPVGSPSFGQELGQQVAWLGGQDVKQARIRLNPEELGPLDVKVSVLHDHVDVSFVVQHPQAVHAVQQTLSQLDSMLAQHGLTLGQAQVGQGGAGNQSGQGNSAGSTTSGEAESSDAGAVASVGAAVVSGVGLLDTFA